MLEIFADSDSVSVERVAGILTGLVLKLLQAGDLEPM